MEERKYDNSDIENLPENSQQLQNASTRDKNQMMMESMELKKTLKEESEMNLVLQPKSHDKYDSYGFLR